MWWLVVIAALAAKPKSAGALPGSASAPATGCPPGAVPAGSPPPAGTAVWCERPIPGGTVREGPTFVFTERGTLRAKGAYADGLEHGSWTTYHPSGAVHASGQMVLGKRSGEWVTYWPSGQVESKGRYLDGERHGRWEIHSEDGARTESGEYIRGDRVGAWVETGFDQPLRERIYRDGRLVSVHER